MILRTNDPLQFDSTLGLTPGRPFVLYDCAAKPTTGKLRYVTLALSTASPVSVLLIGDLPSGAFKASTSGSRSRLRSAQSFELVCAQPFIQRVQHRTLPLCLLSSSVYRQKPALSTSDQPFLFAIPDPSRATFQSPIR